MSHLIRSPRTDAAVETELHEIWNVLRRQAWLLTASAVLGLAAGYVFVPRPEAVYRTSALIRVEERRSGLPRIEERGLVATGNLVETEIEVLRSRTLAKAVVDALRLPLRIVEAPGPVPPNLIARLESSPAASGSFRLTQLADGRFQVVLSDGQALPRFFAPGEVIPLEAGSIVLGPAALEHPVLTVEIRSAERVVDALLSRLRVSRTNRDADIIRVEYQDTDPLLARDIVNTLAERFLHLRNEAQTAEARNQIRFLRQQLDTIAQQLTRAEDELRAFRERVQVIDPAAEGSAQLTRLASLQAERSAIEAERSALTRVLNEEQFATSEPGDGEASRYRRLMGFPTLLRNPVASDILRSLLQLEHERTTLLARRKPADPDVQVLSSRIREVEEQLRGFIRTYLAGLSSQVRSMDAVIADFQRNLSEIPAHEVQFARLSRQPELLAEIYATLQSRLTEAEIAQAGRDPTVRVVDYAPLPAHPLGSRRNLMVGVCGVFGLLLGIMLGFAREYNDRSVRSRAEVQTALGVPVLGLIPRVNGREHPFRDRLRDRVNRRQLGRTAAASGVGTAPSEKHGEAAPERSLAPAAPHRAAAGLALDSYETLHTNLLFAGAEREGRTLVVTSALPRDGKTTTAANLALTLAVRGARVLLIDADLRRGRIAEVFRLPSKPGLTEVLTNSAPLQAAVRTIFLGEGRSLQCLTAGSLPASPGQLLGSHEMRLLVSTLETEFERIIIDSPPANLVADAAILGRHGFGVVAVVRAGATPFEALLYSAEQFRHANIALLGAVLNDIDFDRDATYDVAYRSHRYGRSYYAARG